MKVHSYDIREHPDGPKQVSDKLLSEGMAQVNHHQSLERLNERGGMSYGEIYCNIHELSLRQLYAFPNLDYCMKIEQIIDMAKEP